MCVMMAIRSSEGARQYAHHLPELSSPKLADGHECLVNGDLP
jgi:hypothetical protein